MAKYKDGLYNTAFPNGNLTGYEKLVSIVADPDIAAELASGGGIEFDAADGVTPIPFGLYPETDLASGTILARVLTDVLTAATTGDTMFRLRYGSALTTVEDKAAVAARYDFFMPLEEDPGGIAPQMFDWKSESNVGTSSGMLGLNLVAGQVGNNLLFDGTNDYIQISSPLVAAGDFDISCVFLFDDLAFARVFFGTTVNLNALCGIVAGDTTHIGVRTDGVTVHFFAVPSMSAATRYLLRLVRISGVIHLYLNGTESSSGGISEATSCTFDLIGTYPNTGAFHLGQIDEVTLSSLFAGSVDEIDYQYQDYFNNSDTFSLGPEHDETPSFPRVYTETYTQLHPGAVVGRRYGDFGGRGPASPSGIPCPYIPSRADQQSQFEAVTNNPFEFSARTSDNTYAPGRADECR